MRRSLRRRWSARRRSMRWPGRWPGRGCRTRCSSTSPARRSPTAPSPTPPARADALRRTLLTPVVNATGVLLHTNLGRAPLGPPPGRPGPSRVELDLATGERGSPPAGGRQPARPAVRRRGRRSSSTTTRPPCCSCWPRSPPAAHVPVSRGESVEIGGGFRVPEVMEQSGARLVDVGTTNRTRLADYRRAVDAGATSPSCSRCTRATTASTASSRTRRSPSWRRSACRSSSTSAAACVDATCPWLARRRTRRRGWPASRPPRQTLAAGAALVTFSGDKLLGGPQAGIIAGRRRPRRRAAPATRWPGRCDPAASCSARCRSSPSPTCARDVVAPSRSGGWPRRPSPTLRGPGRRDRRAPPARRPCATDALPGAGSAPGDDDPVVRRAPAPATTSPRCAPTIRRSSPAPATARTVLDLRAVEPTDDAVVVEALRRCG